MIRAAYRTIGQAVLDTVPCSPPCTRLLEAVSEALGCDYALLYLVDDSRRTAGIAAGVGRPCRRISRATIRGSRWPAAIPR